MREREPRVRGSTGRGASAPVVFDEAELVWDEMRKRLMGLTTRQLRQIARDEGICLGYDASRKDTTVAAIVSARRHRAMSGMVELDRSRAGGGRLVQGVREHTEGSGELTGIERLQGMSMAFRGYTWGASLSEALGDIAGQIKREMQTSSEVEKMKCDPVDASMSAYDLLPEEEREAIAWARDHGGIEHVKAHWSGRVPLSNVKRMVELHKEKRERLKAHALWLERKCHERQRLIVELNKLVGSYRAALNGVCERLGLTDGTGLPDMPEVIWAELDRRLMPEGMEWPRFEDGEAVRPGDKLQDKDGDWFEAVSFVFTCSWWSIRGYQTEGFGDLNEKTRRSLEGMAYGTRVKRPVLAGDGKPLREGETVYLTGLPTAFVVDRIEYEGGGTPNVYFADGSWAYPDLLTHERPDSWERLEEDVASASCPDVYCANHHIDASDASYEWAMARDIVRRAKALAGDA